MSNMIALTGRLVADCRKAEPSGTSVLNFKVANDVGYGERKHTNFIECALWGKRAEGGLAEYLVKGTQVFVIGELTVKEPRESKGKHYNDISIRVSEVDLIGGKSEAKSERAEPMAAKGSWDDDGSDLPF